MEIIRISEHGEAGRGGRGVVPQQVAGARPSQLYRRLWRPDADRETDGYQLKSKP